LVEEAERVVQLEDPVASTTSGDIPNETATAPPDLQRANSTAVLDPDEEEPLQRKKSQDKKSVGRPSSSSSTKGKANHQKAESGSSSWWRRPSRPVFTRKSSGKSVGSSSFVTAAESLGDEQIDDATDAEAREFNMPGFSQIVTNEGDGSRRESTLLGSPSMSNNAASINSRVGLLDKPGGAGGDGDRRLTLDLGAATSPRPQSSSALKTPKSVLKRPGTSRTKRPESPASQQGEEQPPVNRLKPLAPVATNLVRFTEPSKNAQADQDFDDHGDKQKRSVKTHLRRRSSFRSGQLMKAERMLVRVDSTAHDLGNDFDENYYFSKEAKSVNKWREFVVVCRQSTADEAKFVLRMYKSRVIPFIEDGKKDSKKFTHEIYLNKKDVHVNLFSSLDKTIVLWAPFKKFNRIYILKPQSASDAVQWYHFLRTCLGWKRPPELRVHVPDLDVMLTLDNPFASTSAGKQISQSNKMAEFSDELQDEGGVARSIILRCLQLLAESPVSHTTELWKEHGERLGLAWRRYDRLEWISGVSEQNMYGSMAMQVSHELELLPKRHYPTNVKKHASLEPGVEEPPPVEGFLVRMTSQKGRHSRAGKNFYKKLYFFTNNHLLCFCQPSKALPPKPPKLPQSLTQEDTPAAKEIAEKIPLIYAVNPFPLENGKIKWLNEGASSEQKAEADRQAYEEAERRTNTLLAAEAYINLAHVVRIRKARPDSSPPTDQPEIRLVSDTRLPDEDLDSADEGEDHTNQDDDIARSFELTLKNNLTIRLQAYSKAARKEWVRRLRGLVAYWKARTTEDSTLLKSIRHENLDRLQIDEEMEAVIGQYARKWEVRRSVADSSLWNMCGIACCRSMAMYGVLYRKPRMRSTFKRCNVILSHGKMLVFQSALRKTTGRILPHIHHERQEVIDLEDTYVYSGLITDSDLMYQNQTFSPEHPGHSATPRIYLEDGWTSTDEDTMTCFCLWRGKRKSLFRGLAQSDDGQVRRRLRYVSSLGAPGRTMVFKTRSRAERDQWVLSIGLEIERLKQGEAARESDIRITGEAES